MKPKTKKDRTIQKKMKLHEDGVFKDDREKRRAKKVLKRQASKVRRQERFNDV